jgi:hypothetical protein
MPTPHLPSVISVYSSAEYAGFVIRSGALSPPPWTFPTPVFMMAKDALAVLVICGFVYFMMFSWWIKFPIHEVRRGQPDPDLVRRPV